MDIKFLCNGLIEGVKDFDIPLNVKLNVQLPQS